MKHKNKKKIRGSVLIETIIATAIFSMLSGVIISTLIQIRESQYDSYLYNQAGQLVKEGMEAVISIKGVGTDAGTWNNQNGFDTFTAETHYLIVNNENNNWELTTIKPEKINNVFDRSIIIQDVKRHNQGVGDIDITNTGSWETALSSWVVTKKITIRVEWLSLYKENKRLEITTYLVNWGNPLIFNN